MDGLFKGRHFDQGIIVLCVRWYLRYKLSFRDLAEMMAERGLSLAHTTIMRWIQCYVPEFEKRWNRFARPAGRSWRVDETYVKIRGRWTYRRIALQASPLHTNTALYPVVRRLELRAGFQTRDSRAEKWEKLAAAIPTQSPRPAS